MATSSAVAKQRFSKHSSAALVYTFDFTNQLADLGGTNLNASASVSIQAQYGDDTANALTIGTPSIADPVVTVQISAGVDDVVYELLCTVVDDAATPNTLALVGILEIQDDGLVSTDESTSTFTFFDAARTCMRMLSGSRVYYTGTVSITTATVTLTDGTFPTWITADHIIQVDDELYGITSRGSGTSLTLDSSAVTGISNKNYCVYETDEEETRSFLDAVKRGTANYRNPHSIPGKDRYGNNIFDDEHEWTWLFPTQTLALSSGTAVYALPVDYGQSVGDWTYQSGDSQDPIAMVSEAHIQRLRSNEGASGNVPKYVAVRPKTTDLCNGQRWEAIFYPTPNAAETVEYRYRTIHDRLNPSKAYPPGGADHSATWLAAVAAEMELDSEDERAERFEEFEKRLIASWRLDKKVAERQLQSTSYPDTDASIGCGTWFAQEIGRELGLGANPNTWDHPTLKRVQNVINRGLRQFYLPTQFMREIGTHRWSFLRLASTITTTAPYSTGTIAIASGVVTLTGGTFASGAADGELTVAGVTYTIASRDNSTQLTLDDTSVTVSSGASYTLEYPHYNLASDFGGIESPITYQPGTSTYYPAIDIISVEQIRVLRQWNTVRERPVQAAVYPRAFDATAGTQWRLTFFPVPDAAYVFDYRYRVNPGTLSISTTAFPYGGSEHYETMLASCMAVADEKHTQRFMQLLQASVAMDRAEKSPHTLGFNDDSSDGEHIPYYRHSDPVTFGGVAYD